MWSLNVPHVFANIGSNIKTMDPNSPLEGEVSMKKLIDLQRKVVPEVLVNMEKRYAILKEISLNSPIGRRMLATKLKLSERVVRTEVEFLKEQNLINIDASGMFMTKEGTDVLENLSSFISEIKGITKLEEILTKRLGIKKIIIIPSSIDECPQCRADMAKIAGKYFFSIIKEHKMVGITGGTTMHSFADNLHQTKTEMPLTIVPARGGLGEQVEIQANNIAAMVSKKLNGNYLLLHVPDNIDKDIIDSISSIPQVKSTLDAIDEIDILIFGIGNAADMAKRRRSSEEECVVINERGAVSEAFGHYFNIEGEIVYETSTVGIKLEKYKNLKDIIGIAGGKKKAEAILSIARINNNLVLVTDESAANYLMEITGGFDNI